MKTEQLEAIRKRANKASAGDWYAEINTFGNDFDVHLTNIKVQPGIASEVFSEADADFIASAREDIPALLAEVERLQKALDVVTPPTNPNKRPCVARNITLGGKS